MKQNYRHLVEKPQLCGPTCIQMILLRRGIWIDQEQIAKEVDAKIPKKDASKYKVKLKITKDKNELGIVLGDFKNNNDIIANFWMKHFEKEKDWGHFVLVSSLNHKTVTFCDPEQLIRVNGKLQLKNLLKQWADNLTVEKEDL